MAHASFPFLPDPQLRLTGDPARDARIIAGDPAHAHQAHWQGLLDRDLIGPPRTPAQESARAACEASARALDHTSARIARRSGERPTEMWEISDM